MSLPETDQQPWSQLIQVNRQTAASCAHETFFDCPAWEQAQFLATPAFKPGSIIVGNDDRLTLKAMRLRRQCQSQWFAA